MLGSAFHHLDTLKKEFPRFVIITLNSEIYEGIKTAVKAKIYPV